MKTLTKTQIASRFAKSNIAPTAKYFNLKNIINNDGYDHAVKIVVPGKPIQDSRPRFARNSDNMHAYNPHKANLMKVFDVVYKGSVLENICVIEPCRIELKLFIPIPKIVHKDFNKNDNKNLSNESIPCINKPDNDNYEKVVWDVLQDREFMVILADERIISNCTEKYYVAKESDARLEIIIRWNDYNHEWYMNILSRSKDYLNYRLSSKYMNQYIDKDLRRMYFYKTIVEYAKVKKGNIGSKFYSELSKTLSKYYSIDELRLLADGVTKDKIISQIINNIERILK